MKAVVQSCSRLLIQQHAVLETLTPEMYTYVSPVWKSSAGCHVRHCLDHMKWPLEAALDSNMEILDYDIRMRNTLIEKDVHAAKEEIIRFQKMLQQCGNKKII